MKDLYPELKAWLDQGTPFALATVVKTWRSAPRMEGSAMAVSAGGNMIGSVSGGCVEGAVIKAALEIIDSGTPRLLAFGVSDEDAWTVGLSCGGQIEVWVERIDGQQEIWSRWLQSMESNKGVVLVKQLAPPFEQGLFVSGGDHYQIPTSLTSEVAEAYRQHKTQQLEQYFLSVMAAKSKMIIVGAAHVSLDLLKLAHIYDFETYVIDPRGIFTDASRFKPQPHYMYEDWPAQVLPQLTLDADTYVVVLTHDPKIDDQALQMVLSAPVAYIGALGSKKTHQKRVARLQQMGIPDEQIDRIQGPVGIAINARRPAEIALSIMAQIIQVRNRYL